VAWKLLKPQLAKLMSELDISVGKFPDKRDETAEAKQDASVYEAAKSAAEELRNARTTLMTDMEAYFQAAQDLQNGKNELRRDMDALGGALEEAATKRGMKDRGRDLSQMLTFAAEGTAFVTQAEAVILIGDKELNANKADQAPSVAEIRAREFHGQVFFPEAYEGKEIDGARAMHYSAQPFTVHISDSDRTELTDKEASGLGTADRGTDGRLSANTVIRNSVTNAVTMQGKARRYVDQLNAMVFGNALAPK
jgi:hypothetical protein